MGGRRARSRDHRADDIGVVCDDPDRLDIRATATPTKLTFGRGVPRPPTNRPTALTRRCDVLPGLALNCGVNRLKFDPTSKAATVVLPIRVRGVVVIDHKPGRRWLVVL